MKTRFENLLLIGNALGWFNRWVLLAVLALMMTVVTGSGLLWGLPAAQAQGNTTTPISTAAELGEIANGLGGDYILTNDIDLQGANWTPIGIADNMGFTGTFDGAGYEISNLVVTGADVDTGCFAGLFGVVAGGVVRNVGLRDVSVSNEIASCQSRSSSTVGALAGSLIANGRVEASYVVGGTVAGYYNVGGLVGLVNGNNGGGDVAVVSSFADVEVVGLASSTDRGGLVGDLRHGGEIRSSYSLGEVGGDGANLGGLVGYVRGGGVEIVNSFTMSEVMQTPLSRGGLIGAREGTAGTVTNSYQTSDSSSDNYLPLADLQAADVNTGGFRSWGDDTCATEATTGAGGVVWYFGAADELPRVNCIRVGVQPRIIVPPGFTTISNAAELRTIADDLDGNYIVINEIDLAEFDATGDRVSWTPLGGDAPNFFSGVFDGAGYEISGLWANTSLNCRFGLFGFVDGGTVRNVGLRDVNVSDTGSGCGTSAVGGLVGALRDGRVEASYVVGGTVEGNVNVGGLVGRVLSPMSGGVSMIVDSFTDVSVMGVSVMSPPPYVIRAD